MRAKASIGLLAVVLGAAGCGGEEPRAMSGIEVRPGCEAVAPKRTGAPVRGLLQPRARVVAEPSRAAPGEIAEVTGYVELSPSQLAGALRARPGYEILFSEDEGFEAEVVVTDGRHRNFWRVLSRCEGGSIFTATVAPTS